MKNLVPGADHFFNYPDVKPGDFGCNVISMHVTTGDAFLCMDFGNLKNNDNGVNEPESIVDPNGSTTGELAGGLQFFGWVDNGDGIYQSTEKILFGTSTKSALTVLNNKSYPIGDSKSGGACKQNDTRYFATCWCAGALTVNTTTGKMTCDGSALGNAAQTDSMTLDVSIRAISSQENPKFICSTSTATSTPGDPKGGGDDGKGDDGKGGKGGDDGKGGCSGNCSNSGNITISNDDKGHVTSTTTSNSNTGGNKGGDVHTGGSTSTASTTNNINFHTVTLPKH
jgi:hypothetical protein